MSAMDRLSIMTCDEVALLAECKLEIGLIVARVHYFIKQLAAALLGEVEMLMPLKRFDKRGEKGHVFSARRNW